MGAIVTIELGGGKFEQVHFPHRDAKLGTQKLRTRPTNAKTIMRPSGEYAFTANSHQIAVLNGVWITVRGAKTEEQANTAFWVALGLPEILIETIDDGPGTVLFIRLLNRNE